MNQNECLPYIVCMFANYLHQKHWKLKSSNLILKKNIDQDIKYSKFICSSISFHFHHCLHFDLKKCKGICPPYVDELYLQIYNVYIDNISRNDVIRRLSVSTEYSFFYFLMRRIRMSKRDLADIKVKLRTISWQWTLKTETSQEQKNDSIWHNKAFLLLNQLALDNVLIRSKT